MMKTTRTLGLHLGTSSIGWAVVEKNDSSTRLLDCGVFKFKDGIEHTDKGEKPMTQTRTEARRKRRLRFRTRLRKVEVLKVLVRYGLCPYLSEEVLKEWKERKVYPMDEEFLRWQHSDQEDNPYADRRRCVSEALDMSSVKDRFALGRAMYHMAQRRGFLSNRKSGKESDGIMEQSITKLNQDMERAGCRYLGEYLYKQHSEGRKVRCVYTAREGHYLKEFEAICERQRLDAALREELFRAIFYQRPLKSHKHLVGRCSLEKSQTRCRVSHPQFEEYRMLQDINNIRIKYAEEDWRPLNETEREAVIPLFHRKSKNYFPFEDIARKLAGKDNYGYRGDKGKEVLFNYPMYKNFNGCVVTARLKSVFGDEWLANASERYALRGDKTDLEVMNDIWHVLESYESREMLAEWAVRNFGLTQEEAEEFAGIPMPEGYGSLSLRAIRKILPHLQKGHRYDAAVLLANLPAVMEYRDDAELLERMEKGVMEIVNDDAKNALGWRIRPVRESVIDFLKDTEGVKIACLDRLYDSTEKVYRDSREMKKGRRQLGSPRLDALKNPMVMRALFQLKRLVNNLLLSGMVDENTRINLELSRELNDANTRQAIARYQSEIEKQHRLYKDEICKFMGSSYVPTEDDVLKYQLWEEQKHTCIYTGRKIGLADFLGNHPAFEVDYIIPRSRDGEDSQRNKVLCEIYYNRQVKQTKMPSELDNFREIMDNVAALGWMDEAESLRKGIEKYKSKKVSSKDEKDKAIRARRKMEMRLGYLQGKIGCLRAKEAPKWLPNMEGVNAAVIRKYAKEFLGSVFGGVFCMKDIVTAGFRDMWGLNRYYSEQKRCSYAHHAVNAITLACIGKSDYDRLARYFRDLDGYKFYRKREAMAELPWDTFIEDVRNEVDSILIPHYTPDNMGKKTKKKVRRNGEVVLDADGKPMYMKGDCVRGSLHADTFYGAIKHDGRIRYVIRKKLADLKETDVAKIVDDKVREKVAAAVAAKGFAEAVSEGVMMNETLGIKIRKVRIFATTANPLRLKRHRDISRHEHKRDYYVVNELNYAMGIYSDGRKNTYKMMNCMNAGKYFNGKTGRTQLFDSVDEKGNVLRYVLKQGTMMLLYEDSPKELFECSQKELSQRLYRVTGLSQTENRNNGQSRWYGVIVMKHHKEARKSSELILKSGKFRRSNGYCPVYKMQHTQFEALVEGRDFDISVTGRIRFIRDTK